MENQVDKIRVSQQSASVESAEMEGLSGAPLQLKLAERPEVVAQRKIQAAADESPEVQQLMALQQAANDSPQVAETRQLQAAANEATLPREGASVNRTGLPDQLKSGIESLSGMSMDAVKVHYNSSEPAKVDAHAYAQGSEIHVAPGQEKHLPHEAWHVVQQAQGRVKPTKQLKDKSPINDDAGLEREATEMGAKALQTPTKSVDGAADGNLKPLASGGAAPVQRVTAQLLPASDHEDGTIFELAIVGRPQSAHGGTMGDHSTAFTTIQLGLENQLAHVKLRDASLYIAELSNQITRLPGWELLKFLPENHRNLLDEAFDNLKEAVAYFKDWRHEGVERYKQSHQNDEISDDEQDKMEEEVDEFEDVVTAKEVSQLQWAIECYLELRELVPLSTVNTKAVNASLAGKGKGENASPLVDREAGKEVSDEKLKKSIMSLFDARSAAVVSQINDEQLLQKVAPGVPIFMEPSDRIDYMIKQHMFTVESFHKQAMSQLRENNELGNLVNDLWKAVEVKRDENEKASKGEEVEKTKQGKRTPKKQYVATNIHVDENENILGIKIDGRPKSPFSGTMGAHTTAFIVYKDLLWSSLVGNSLVDGAKALSNLMTGAKASMQKAMSIFHADPKQLHLLIDNLEELNFWQTHLGKFEAQTIDEEDVSSWARVIDLQQAVVAFLELINAIPGGTLDIANTNGRREGAHRGTLLHESSHPRDRRRAILGMLDVSGIETYMETTTENIKGHTNELRTKRTTYSNMTGNSLHTGMGQNLKAPTNSLKDAIEYLIRHHLELIDLTYPGALTDTGLDPKASRENLLKLYTESLQYVGEDKDTFKGVRLEEDED